MSYNVFVTQNGVKISAVVGDYSQLHILFSSGYLAGWCMQDRVKMNYSAHFHCYLKTCHPWLSAVFLIYFGQQWKSMA